MKDKDMKFIERRKYVRLGMRIKISFQIQDRQDPNAEMISTVTKNISMKGICFISEKKIEPGTILKLEISLPNQSQFLHFVGQVRWSAPIKENEGESGSAQMFEVGVKFFVIDKNDVIKFADYICDKAFEEEAKSDSKEEKSHP